MRHRCAGALLALPLWIAGCSLDYQATQIDEKVAEGVPNTVAVGLVQRVHKNGRLAMQLEAARAESYNSSNQTVIAEARFVEYGQDGEKRLEGRAQRVVYHTDTENAEMSGSVYMHSFTDKAEVSAESLSWDDAKRRVAAPAAETVTIRKEDGTFISGRGFTADQRTREMGFSGPVEGRYVWDDKEK